MEPSGTSWFRHPYDSDPEKFLLNYFKDEKFLYINGHIKGFYSHAITKSLYKNWG